MADTDSPQEGRAAVRLGPYPLVMFDHVDGSLGDFHFLANACVPNQKAMIDDSMSISSSENTSAIAAANGTPVL
jgi:hypothetical protein